MRALILALAIWPFHLGPKEKPMRHLVDPTDNRHYDYCDPGYRVWREVYVPGPQVVSMWHPMHESRVPGGLFHGVIFHCLRNDVKVPTTMIR